MHGSWGNRGSDYWKTELEDARGEKKKNDPFVMEGDKKKTVARYGEERQKKNDWGGHDDR